MVKVVTAIAARYPDCRFKLAVYRTLETIEHYVRAG